MAVDGFARALGFAAATAESVSALEQKVDTSVEEVNETLNTTKTEITNELNTTKEELNNSLTQTTEELNSSVEQTRVDLEALVEEKRVKVFDSNSVIYNAMDPAVREGFDIAIAAPPVQLEDAQIEAINTMVGDAGETIINMSERELNDKLDAIIGGE